VAETASDAELPPAFNYSLQLTFAMLSFILKKPLRKPPSRLLTHLTVILTLLERSVKSWPKFLSSVHEGVLKENFLEWKRRGMRKRRRTPLTTRKRTVTMVWTFRMVTRT